MIIMTYDDIGKKRKRRMGEVEKERGRRRTGRKEKEVVDVGLPAGGEEGV